MRELKWTDTSYRLLYEKLTEKFGPYQEWEKAHSPGRGLDEEYKAFLEAFAIVVGVDGDDPPRGVAGQISFIPQALKATDLNWLEPGKARQAMNNITAAYNAGFVGNKIYPSLYGQSVASQRARAA
jgi:hypothetical protein